MRIMTQQLTEAIEAAQLKWQPSSLEFFSPSDREEMLRVHHRDEPLPYKQLPELWLIATLTNRTGDTRTSISARRACTTNQYYNNQKFFNSKGNEAVKVAKWSELGQSTFLHGC